MKIMGPAGGRDAFDAALSAGADEIYMGLTGYGARRFAANFSTDEFCRALNDAHRVGAAVNLTLNTIMDDAEINAVAPDIARLYESGLDGVIVQDWGVISWLATNFPDLPIHGSTQMALANKREVLFGEKIGLSRVVLPRELSFEEIATVRKASQIELEVFCSGALCLATSGKCYLSSFVGGRSGNRGACAQPCRQRYRQISPIEKDQDNHPEAGYLLSLKDQLHNEEEIRRLTEIGVDVIKIEGRMKSPPYVYEAVRYYRRILDRIAGISPEISRKMFFMKEDAPNRQEFQEETTVNPIKTDLDRLFNRGYGGGFLTEHDPDIQNPIYASHYGFPIGEIRRGKILLFDTVAFGDGVVYLDDKLQKIDGTNVSEIRLQPKLYGDKECRVSEAGKGEIVLFDDAPPANACYLYKTFDQKLQKETLHRIKQIKRHRPMDLRLTARIGRPLELTLTVNSTSVRVISDQPLEKSLKQKNDRDSLTKSLDRFGDSPFFLRDINLDFDPDVFIPKSLLNALRQEGVQKTEEAILANFHRTVPNLPPQENKITSGTAILTLPETEWAVVVRTKAQSLAAFKAGIRKIYFLRPPVRFEENADDWLRQQEKKTSASELFDPAPLAGNLVEALYYEENGIPFSADPTFNVGNLRSARFLLDHFTKLTTLYLSTELAKETVARLHQTLAPVLAQRGGRVGLSVYGHPIGMFTRKTLFARPKTELENQDGRHFILLQNQTGFYEDKIMTGSSVFYAPPNDVLDDIKPMIPSGGWEFRLDFTLETPDEITRTLKRLTTEKGTSDSPSKDCYSSRYGFSHPIF